MDIFTKVNTILAVFRIKITIESIEDFVPSLWSVLLEKFLEKFPKNVTSRPLSPWIPATSSGFERIKSVVDKLESITETSLQHLDVAGILYKQPTAIQEIVDLFWELFLIVEASSNTASSSSSGPSSALADVSRIDDLDNKPESAIKTTQTTIPNESLSTSDSSIKLKPSVQLSEQQVREMGLGPISESFATARGSKSVSPKKKLRFSTDLYSRKGRVLETPLLHALKLQKSSIQKQNKQQPIEKYHTSLSVLKMIDLHKSIGTRQEWEPSNSTRTMRKFVGTVSEPDIYDYSMVQAQEIEGLDEIEEYLSEIVENRGEFTNATERNLESFIDQVTRSLPLIDGFSEHEMQQAWKMQIQLTKKALDDRLWTQKVLMQKELSRIDNFTPLDGFVKTLSDQNRLKKQKQESERFRKASNSLKERYRKIALLTKQYDTIEQEAKRELQRQKHKEQSLKSGLMSNYMKEQRNTIIEERRQQRLDQRQSRREADKQESIKQAQLLEQIAMLKEQIAEAEQEERLIRQGEQEALRELLKDSKKLQKAQIDGLKSTMSNEWRTENYRQDAAQDLGIEFNLN